MSGFDINQAIQEVKLLQALNYRMLDYLRTQTAWLLEHCEKYDIPLPDLEKAKLFFRTSGQILERNSPTESQQRNKTTDESTEPNILFFINVSLIYHLRFMFKYNYG